MLVMVATSRHHGRLAIADSKDGLQGALFDFWTPDAKHRHHKPNTTHLGPIPPMTPWPLMGIRPAGTCPAWTSCCGWGRGCMVGRVASWEGGDA